MDMMATMATTGLPTAAPTSTTTTTNISNSSPLITPPPQLSIREVVVDIAGNTLVASLYPVVTTGWWESVLPDGIHTWISIVFTQTFATTVLDQLGEAGSGRIGLEANATGTMEVMEGKAVGDSTAVSLAGEKRAVKMMFLLGMCVLLCVMMVDW